MYVDAMGWPSNAVWPSMACTLWHANVSLACRLLHRLDGTPVSVVICLTESNKFFFAKLRRQQNSLFRQFRRFFAKWGLFFAKWGLFFASLYVRKSPAVLMNLGDPIAPLHHCRFRQPNLKLLSLIAQLERNA